MRSPFARKYQVVGLLVVALLVSGGSPEHTSAAQPLLPPSTAASTGPSDDACDALCRAMLALRHDPTPTAASGGGSPPWAIYTYPPVAARDVPTYTLVSAVFDLDVDPNTINASTFFLSASAAPLVGTCTYISVSKAAIFHPATPLAPSTVHTATLTTGILSLDGEPLRRSIVWSFATGAGPLDLNGMHIYWGDLHAHTQYSDGKGTPADAFATARGNGLDFFALTDHSNQLAEDEWQDIQVQADAASVAGAFVGQRGFEYTSPHGHINVFDTDNYVWEWDPSYDTLTEFYAWLASQPRAIGQFTHPLKTATYDWNFYDFAYDPVGAEKMVLREAFASQAGMYLQPLCNGWRVGTVDGADNHWAEWGRRTTKFLRVVGVVAPSLTQQAILDALGARRTFSVFDRNFALVMQANGKWMGSVISNTATLSFTITAYDPDPTDSFHLVLYDNDVPVAAAVAPSDAALYTWRTSIPGVAGHYYYVKACHDVNALTFPAFSSPIWLDTSEIPGGSVYVPMVERG